MTQIPQHLDTQITRAVRLDYLLYLPPGYEDDLTRRWPLILFLHSAGGRGSDLDLVRRGDIPLLLDSGHELPFVVVSPQCPVDSHWTLHADALKAMGANMTLTVYPDAGHNLSPQVYANPELYAWFLSQRRA